METLTGIGYAICAFLGLIIALLYLILAQLRNATEEIARAELDSVIAKLEAARVLMQIQRVERWGSDRNK